MDESREHARLRARQRLCARRARRALDPSASAGPANDLLDEVISITTPDDLRSMLDQLKSSYDVVNLTAKGDPAWDLHYAEFGRYYQDQRPKIGWMSGTGTKKVIEDRRRQLETWKAELARRGVQVKEPPRKEEPSPGGAFLGDLGDVIGRVGVVVTVATVGAALLRRSKDTRGDRGVPRDGRRLP